MGKQWKRWQTFFSWAPKITADGDYSHEIKRCLLLGRKAMTNLDSILKSRDITLLTKVHLVKAMVFPIVMYGCESSTMKKESGSSVHGILQARILEWVALPFIRGSSWPRDQIQVSCIAWRFFTIWVTREAHLYIYIFIYIYQFSSVTQSCPTLCDSMDCGPSGSSVHGNSPDKNTGMGCHALLQGIFQTQGSNPSLLHCSWILYRLSYQGRLEFWSG